MYTTKSETVTNTKYVLLNKFKFYLLLFSISFYFKLDKSLSQTKRPLKSEQTNKYTIDNSLGFKRTHIDFKKLEDEQKKWNEIKNFINTEGDSKRNQTMNNWKTIIESNSVDTNHQNLSSSSTTNRWLPKLNHKTSPNNKINYNNNYINNPNNHLNSYNNHLNKRTFEGISTSSASDPHNSVMVQLHHLQKLLTKLLTRKSTKKMRSQKSLKLFNDTDLKNENEIETNEIDDIEENEDDERLANNIVDKLLLTDTGVKNLVFDWIISDWSPCSVNCGTGFQVKIFWKF